jgi:hypothetical protein
VTLVVLFVLVFESYCFAGDCRRISTGNSVGLENGKVKIEFDKATGSLLSLKNLAVSDDYLKEPGDSGNTFRVYLNPTELPPEVTSTFPWNARAMNAEDTLGGDVLDSANCKLMDSSFNKYNGAGELRLVSQDPGSSLEFTLQVRLADNGDALDCTLTVRNGGNKPQELMTAFPYLTGLGLGDDRNTNLAVQMGKHGIPGEPAWIESGGIYGRGPIMQWQAIYEPSVNVGLGLMVMDERLRNKIIRRSPVGGLSVLYFPVDTLKPGQAMTYPTTRLIVHQGNWRHVARQYRRWFSNSFTLRMPPAWYNEIDMYSGWWIPDADAVAESKERVRTGLKVPNKLSLYQPEHPVHPPCSPYGDKPENFTSFEQLPLLYLGHPVELIEWAMYHQGMVNIPSRGQDGTYHFRSDLGGAVAMRKGVQRAHAIGRKVMFYVASISARRDSDLFKGTRMEDWLCMEKPGEMLNIGYPEGVSMCFGYEPWQDHLAQVCKRLIWETGADGVRLDEFGTAFIVCQNPVHNHESPYDGIKWTLELLRKVRRAIDEVNPDAILMTEGSVDFMHFHSDAGGLQMWDCGHEIEAIRVAIPTYRGPGYHPGAIETALNGWAANRTQACRTWLPKASKDQWLPPRPDSYPRDGGPELLWHELRATFRQAQTAGAITDTDPLCPADADWVGRIWQAPDYWVMTGGHMDGSELTGPSQIKLAALPASINSAYEIDAKTLEINQAGLSRSSDGIFVTVSSGFSAVLLPTPNCPPLLRLDTESRGLQAGKVSQIRLRSFGPWAGKSQVNVKIEIPSLTVTPSEVVLPAAVEVMAPKNTLPGKYPLKVSGNCLPLKRWVTVQ